MSSASDRPSHERAAPPPDSEGQADSANDPRLFRMAQEYLAELEAGKKPDRAQWLARCPELADALTKCLDGLEIVHYGARQVRGLLPDAPYNARTALESDHAIPLGDFKILREIGRGGMGIVYEAVQLSLGRHVALKVLPLAGTFDAKQLQRFRQEAQVAAQLHHSNIVPVYAVGCERGIHFYAMQLIDGQSLELVIRQLRQQAGLSPTGAAASGSKQALSNVPSLGATDAWSGRTSPAATAPPMPTENDADAETLRQCSAQFSARATGKDGEFFRAVARCMAQSASALEYAHQQGIIHRDIKPANLLIDLRGNVWVADFGLAHFHANPGLTETGDMLGTVRYMSPEQASGQHVLLDHRTDIYSLAATFYELLTLQPVFAGNTRHTLLLQVLNREPRPLRAVDRRVPVELETIVLKSLSKSAADRYASAQELADDLNRFLRDEPIRAKPPSWLEQGRKWTRRHPSLIAAGVIAMFLTLIVSLVTIWLISKANARAEVALAQERLRAEEAEKRFKQARQAVDLLIEVSQEELAHAPPFHGLQKRLLEAALVYYQDFIKQRRDDPSSQAELIAVEKRLKKIIDDLSVLEGAGQLILLADHGVQDDMALSDAQRDQVGQLDRQFRQLRHDSLHDFARLTDAQRQAKFLELARVNEQAMRKILTPEQRNRLGQIALQLQGLNAFNQPEIISQLQLTDAQRQTIRQIETECFASLGDYEAAAHHGPPPPELREKAFRAANDKALAVLAPEQLKRWNLLIGARFTATTDLLPPGPHPGPDHGPDHGPPPPM